MAGVGGSDHKEPSLLAQHRLGPIRVTIVPGPMAGNGDLAIRSTAGYRSLPMRADAVGDMQRAEFDKFADEYYQQHVRNIAVTGESPEYFSEYKIADLAEITAARSVAVGRILDFGSGIGNSVPYFRKYFPHAALDCADVSTRSIDLARTRYPGGERYVPIVEQTIPVEDASCDLVFSACVFHHIPHAEHRHWLEEMRRTCRPGGLLAIFEHNPFNPLTRRAVDTCPFDENALLIRPGDFRRLALAAGWRDVEVRYRIFFPRALARLRPLERWLRRVVLGAQYCVIAVRP